MASYLRLSRRFRALLLGVFAVDCVVEVTGITVQAWRHVPSHLNNTTPLNAVIAFSLAFGGGVLIVVLGTVLIRGGHRAQAYDDAGFLKWFHAVTLHGMPLLAWWLARA
ncbi:MAG TPA: hypothetical protein VH373_24450 [Jatrophihabitantaceae bacterium]